MKLVHVCLGTFSLVHGAMMMQSVSCKEGREKGDKALKEKGSELTEEGGGGGGEEERRGRGGERS